MELCEEAEVLISNHCGTDHCRYDIKKGHIRKKEAKTRDFRLHSRTETWVPSQRWDLGPKTRKPKGGIRKLKPGTNPGERTRDLRSLSYMEPENHDPELANRAQDFYHIKDLRTRSLGTKKVWEKKKRRNNAFIKMCSVW